MGGAVQTYPQEPGDVVNKHDTGGPWAPLAPGRYCLRRCYCGGCPQYVPMSVRPTNTPDVITALDSAAVRRHGYRAARGRGQR